MISLTRQLKAEDLKLRYNKAKFLVYRELIDQGYYLPPINSPAVTREYLRDVQNREVIAIKKADLIAYDFPCVAKPREIFAALQVASPLPLGFPITALPSKQFMLNLLSHINPEHELLTSMTEIERPVVALAPSPAINDFVTYNFRRYEARTKRRLREYKVQARELLRENIKDRLAKLGRRYPFLIINFNR